jgi:hypothetical protein
MGVTSAENAEARVTVIQTGSTLVSPAVPNRASRRLPFAYTGLFQRRSRRIKVPVKAFLVEVGGHRVLVDTGWSEQCATHPLRHMGFSLWFASEPVVAAGEGMGPQLKRLGLTPQQLDAVPRKRPCRPCGDAARACIRRGACGGRETRRTLPAVVLGRRFNRTRALLASR